MHEKMHVFLVQVPKPTQHVAHPVVKPKSCTQETAHDSPEKMHLIMHPWMSPFRVLKRSLTTALSAAPVQEDLVPLRLAMRTPSVGSAKSSTGKRKTDILKRRRQAYACERLAKIQSA